MYSNIGSSGWVDSDHPQQQIGNFYSYDADPTLNPNGGGYNASFDYPNQQPATSSSNANFVPLGSGRHFPHTINQHAQLSFSDNSNANFVPLGSGHCFLPQRNGDVVCYEDSFEMQKIGRKRRRGRKSSRRARMDNCVADQPATHDFGEIVNYDDWQQWNNGWEGQQQFGQNEAASNYDQYGIEPNQNYEDYEIYYDSYETDQTKELWREELEEQKQEYSCDTCKINCIGIMNYQAHLEGKTHRKKLELQQMNADPDQQKFVFHCELCSVASDNRENYEAHIKGQKHQKALKLVMKSGDPIPPITAIPSDNSSISNSPSCVSIPSVHSLPDTLRQFCDQCVREKVAQIELGPDQLRDAEHLVHRVEQSLFAVSQFLMEDCAVDNSEEPKRLLRGIMRVGLMAKQQLLKSDSRADLVLLCAIVPTVDLLSKIIDHFQLTINGNGEPYVYIVQKVSESAIFVSQIGVSVDVFVTLTCSAMRQWSPGDLDFYPYEEPPNSLPSGPCLRALAEMRRTKFYQVKCAPLAPMDSLIKVLRDIKRRVSAWQTLTDWMIELVVDKVLSDNKKSGELCAGDAFFAFFNAISDGLILGKDFSLSDPCEKLPVDVLANVLEKDRNNIFNSARYAIRQIKGGKIAKLLALDGSSGIPSEHPKKRRKITAQNDQSNRSDGFGNVEVQAVPEIVGFGWPRQPMDSRGEATIW
ncbi:hypothetical protein niasHS_010168 [Heterodera schachtii]|uniref:DZF domain-containing protein n=1 Tax=Heterodera schachtii TaxID=97005 RepID=A0ABD2IYW8_HETSC